MKLILFLPYFYPEYQTKEEEVVDEEVVEESDIGEEEGPSSKGLLISFILNF